MWRPSYSPLCVTDAARPGRKSQDDGARARAFQRKSKALAAISGQPPTAGDLDDRALGFDLEPGSSHRHAVAVADFLNRNVVAITPSAAAMKHWRSKDEDTT